ncbi:GPN-loop GTPase [Chytriomyces sp. MP71]|nr:GPN-loop GTPase [Chytriomyces sp. MP71]
MGKMCQLVMGPAGSGKSTFCSTILTHARTAGRSVHLVNLDPAAEHFEYKPSIDIRDLITLDDVMEELQYGPNGGLVYCLEYLCNNMDWLEEQISNFEEDYLIIDCPGQIELYTHFPIMKQIVSCLGRMGYRTCGVYLLDSQFVQDVSKFFSGVMSAMSAMLQLECPHVNVLSKMDLLGDKANSFELERYFDPDPTLLMEDANKETAPKLHALNRALVQLIEEYNMVSFLPLNIHDEDSVALILSHIDNAIQYGEDVEPKEPKDMEGVEDDDDNFGYDE